MASGAMVGCGMWSRSIMMPTAFDALLVGGAEQGHQDLLGFGAVRPAVAAAYLPVDHGGADGVFCPPVGGFDTGLAQEGEQRRALLREVTSPSIRRSSRPTSRGRYGARQTGHVQLPLLGPPGYARHLGRDRLTVKAPTLRPAHGPAVDLGGLQEERISSSRPSGPPTSSSESGVAGHQGLLTCGDRCFSRPTRRRHRQHWYDMWYQSRLEDFRGHHCVGGSQELVSADRPGQ